ncbi:MAG: hypothetical protein WCQ47_01815 [bacterium]
MSKHVLFYLFFVHALMANDASSYVKKAIPFDKGPQRLSTASKKFYQGLDEFLNEKYSVSYNSFITASKDQKLTIEEKNTALYNAALSLERSSKTDKAIKMYKDITKEKVSSQLVKDSYYRIGACCHKQKNWTCVIESLNNWKNSQTELSLVEEFEFRVRKGTAYFELESYRDVIDYLEAAVKVLKEQRSFLTLNAKNMGYPEEKITLLGLWAMEDLATSYVKVGDNIKLSYPSGNDNKTILSHLNKQIDLKAYYYLKAEDIYIEMLNQGDRDVATKGVHLLGELYKNIYKNLLESEIPPNIKHKKLEKEYIAELKETLKPLLKKAETCFLRNKDASYQYKFDNLWTEKSKAELLTLWN